MQAAIAAGLPGDQKPQVPLKKSLDDLFRARAQQQHILKPLMKPIARACAVPLLQAPIENPDRFAMKKVPVPKTEDQIAKPVPVPTCKE